MNRVVAVIPARGGSKGIHKKNLVDLGGKPLIVWTIEAALNSNSFDEIIVTSDDDEILTVAAEFDVICLRRPKELSSDIATSEAVMLHVIDHLKNSLTVSDITMMLLQPTSPFRTIDSIKESLRLFNEKRLDFLMSIGELEKRANNLFKLNPFNKRLEPLLELPVTSRRRQDSEPIWHSNGAIYITRLSSFVLNPTFYPNNIFGFKMEYYESIDIDTNDDLNFARWLITSGTIPAKC